MMALRWLTGLIRRLMAGWPCSMTDGWLVVFGNRQKGDAIRERRRMGVAVSDERNTAAALSSPIRSEQKHSI